MSMDVKHVKIALLNLFLYFQGLILEPLLVHEPDLIAFNILLKARSFELTLSKFLNEFM